jgi:hypothetical protein
MALIRTRRTPEQVKFFIQAWIQSASTRDVAKMLARSRKDWPFSVHVPSLSVYASQLRSAGVKLPYMEHRGNTVDVSDLNAFLATC